MRAHAPRHVPKRLRCTRRVLARRLVCASFVLRGQHCPALAPVRADACSHAHVHARGCAQVRARTCTCMRVRCARRALRRRAVCANCRFKNHCPALVQVHKDARLCARAHVCAHVRAHARVHVRVGCARQVFRRRAVCANLVYLTKHCPALAQARAHAHVDARMHALAHAR